MVQLTCAETLLSARVVGPLLAAGLDVPHRDTVDRIGYTAEQRVAIGVSPVEDDFGYNPMASQRRG